VRNEVWALAAILNPETRMLAFVTPEDRQFIRDLLWTRLEMEAKHRAVRLPAFVCSLCFLLYSLVCVPEEADKNRRVHCAAAASAAADIDAAPAAAQMDDDIDPALLPAPEERPEAKAAVVKSRLRQQYEE